VGLDRHAMAEQLAQRRSRARAPGQPKQYSSGAEPTGHLTLTPEIRVDHHPGEHGALPDPPRGTGANGGSAAAGMVMNRGDGSRQDECRPLTACLQLLGHRT
jgi:hypothetical protein